MWCTFAAFCCGPDGRCCKGRPFGKAVHAEAASSGRAGQGDTGVRQHHGHSPERMRARRYGALPLEDDSGGAPCFTWVNCR